MELNNIDGMKDLTYDETVSGKELLLCFDEERDAYILQRGAGYGHTLGTYQSKGKWVPCMWVIRNEEFVDLDRRYKTPQDAIDKAWAYFG